MEEYLAKAKAAGLLEVGFADHFPLGLLNYEPRVQVTMHPFELEQYIEQVERLKNSVPGLKVKLGIEVDYLPGMEEVLERLLGKYPFDYVIGSIHFMEDWDFTHPVYADTYRERDIEQLYRVYFALVADICRSGLFDIIGHIDVIKKFGYRPATDLDSLWAETANILKSTDTCFELNTAGKDAPVGDFYPDRRLLEICSMKEVPVTLGSDAHKPGQVGRYFEEAGYKELAVFSKRQRESMLI